MEEELWGQVWKHLGCQDIKMRGKPISLNPMAGPQRGNEGLSLDVWGIVGI